MCGRYTFTSVHHLKDRYHASNDLTDIKPNYNVAPGSMMPVVTKKSPNQALLMKWGLIPHWAKDTRIGYKLINARAETIHEKPAFKSAFHNSRCLVPANGFYEWQKTNSISTPYYIKPITGGIISFAGIYDTWKDASSHKIKTFSIITTKANPHISSIHHRMPLILDRNQENHWINSDTNTALLHSILSAPCPYQLESYQVSNQVNHTHNNSPDLIQKAN